MIFYSHFLHLTISHPARPPSPAPSSYPNCSQLFHSPMSCLTLPSSFFFFNRTHYWLFASHYVIAPPTSSSSDFILLLSHNHSTSALRGVLHHDSGWAAEHYSYLFFLWLWPKLFWTGTSWLPVPEVFLVDNNSENWSWKQSHIVRYVRIQHRETTGAFAISLWAPQQGLLDLYIRCQTLRWYHNLTKGSKEIFTGCTVRADLVSCYGCHTANIPESVQNLLIEEKQWGWLIQRQRGRER